VEYLGVEVEDLGHGREVGRGMVMMMCHAPDPMTGLRQWHSILRMTQDGELDGLVRKRIRGLRVARGWSLDDLAAPPR